MLLVATVEVAKIRRVPEAEIFPPPLFTKNKPFGLLVEVAIYKPAAVRVEVVVPSDTVTAVVKALVPAPPVASAKQVNLPVVAL